MNVQSNAMPESPAAGGPIPPAITPATRPLYWSVRRELWENRSVYIAPLAVAALVLFGFSISTIALPAAVREIAAFNSAHQGAELAKPYNVAAILVMLISVVVGAFYCLDALHGERRDRSILFWKSLPVSDLTTVLSKASIPLVVLPLLAFATIVALQTIMLLLSTVILLANGLSPAPLWAQWPMFHQALILFYGLATLALWYAPIYGWLLLVSAWAQRTTFLWAVLPPAAICVVEKLAFNTTYFLSMLKYRLNSFEAAFIIGLPDRTAGHSMPHVEPIPDPVHFLSSPGLWTGLVFAAAFLFAAIRLRRTSQPI